MKQALSDVKVVDFTQMLQGGWATQKLADMGADVIKIEPPHGEAERHIGYQGKECRGVSHGFLAKNRNKRSVAIDLKNSMGHRAALDIIEEADIVAENFRPDVMDRLGLSYETVSETTPEVIYVSGSAYGSSGPYSDRPGQDLLYQAMTGLTSNTGRADDPPTPSGSVVIDEHSATLIALHVMYALFHRERTGEGQRIEANLLNSAIDLQCQEVTFTLNDDENSIERGEANHGWPLLGPPYGIYESADGHVAIGMSPLDVVGSTFGLSELTKYESDMEIFEDRDEIHQHIESYTRKRPGNELVEQLSEADVQAVEVLPTREIESNPQIQHNEMIMDIDHPNGGTFKTTGFPVEMSKTEASITRRPPRLGEHTIEVLTEVGYDEKRLQVLKEDGVIVDKD